MNVIIVITQSHPNSIALAVTEAKQFFQQFTVKQMFKYQVVTDGYFRAVHMDNSIRFYNVTVLPAVVVVHIAACGKYDFMFFSKYINRFQRTWCNLPCVVVQESHVKVKTDHGVSAFLELCFHRRLYPNPSGTWSRRKSAPDSCSGRRNRLCAV